MSLYRLLRFGWTKLEVSKRLIDEEDGGAHEEGSARPRWSCFRNDTGQQNLDGRSGGTYQEHKGRSDASNLG